MSLIVRIAAIATLLFLPALPLSVEANDKHLSNAPKRTALKVIGADYPPYVLKQGNKATGFAVELLDYVQQENQWALQTTVLPWGRAYQVALEQANVLVLNIGRTAAREDQFLWIDPYTKDDIGLFSLASRDDIEVGKLGSVQQYSVVTYRQGGANSVVKALGFRPDRLVFVDSPYQLVRLLAIGRVDLAADYNRAFHYTSTHFAEKTMVRLPLKDGMKTRIEVGFALSKGTSRVYLQAINGALEKIRADGRFSALEEKWFGVIKSG